MKWLSRMVGSVKKHPYWYAVVFVFILMTIYACVALWPRTINFSYHGENCITQPMLFPSLTTSGDERHNLTPEGVIGVAGFPIFASKMCVEPKLAPEPGLHRSSLSLKGVPFISKSVTIDVPDRPVATIADTKPYATSAELTMQLSAMDTVHDYSIASKDKTVDCVFQNDAITCPLEGLELQQGRENDIRVIRAFQDDSGVALGDHTITILPAVTIDKASVKSNQTIYTQPQRFTLEASTRLTQADVQLVRHDKNDALSEIASDVSVDGSQITIDADKAQLKRPANYSLIVQRAQGEDKSELDKEHTIRFKLSDGPTVKSLNVESRNISPNAQIILQLDQPLKAGQDVADFVTVAGVSAAVTRLSDDQLGVALNGAARCASFNISIKRGLISKHDVKKVSDWKFSGRIQCYTVETIGYSKQGRAIQSYTFGNGPKKILYTGGIHGNELSSNYIMQSWIQALEQNPDRIPDDKQIIVVPALNPDGLAVASRDNAGGVNLNRNFPTTNWESDTQTSTGIDKAGGGSKPASEPETAALVALTNRINPHFVITYHSMGSLINSNDVGIAGRAGREYASTAGYWFVPAAATSDTFGYEVTGTYETWLAERGTPAILIELDTHTGNFFGRNSAAMWAMLRY